MLRGADDLRACVFAAFCEVYSHTQSLVASHSADTQWDAVTLSPPLYADVRRADVFYSVFDSFYPPKRACSLPPHVHPIGLQHGDEAFTHSHNALLWLNILTSSSAEPDVPLTLTQAGRDALSAACTMSVCGSVGAIDNLHRAIDHTQSFSALRFLSPILTHLNTHVQAVGDSHAVRLLVWCMVSNRLFIQRMHANTASPLYHSFCHHSNKRLPSTPRYVYLCRGCLCMCVCVCVSVCVYVCVSVCVCVCVRLHGPTNYSSPRWTLPFLASLYPLLSSSCALLQQLLTFHCQITPHPPNTQLRDVLSDHLHQTFRLFDYVCGGYEETQPGEKKESLTRKDFPLEEWDARWTLFAHSWQRVAQLFGQGHSPSLPGWEAQRNLFMHVQSLVSSVSQTLPQHGQMVSGQPHSLTQVGMLTVCVCVCVC